MSADDHHEQVYVSRRGITIRCSACGADIGKRKCGCPAEKADRALWTWEKDK